MTIMGFEVRGAFRARISGGGKSPRRGQSFESWRAKGCALEELFREGKTLAFRLAVRRVFLGSEKLL